ncbi:MAG: N-6 DNA methylase [Akkermansia sp.]|nr:N-6 DNA methylase [Akkermansia sp.]
MEKKKTLGQFFSGEQVARIIRYYLNCEEICDLIDPMCGIGDMFIPFEHSTVKLFGNEIDTEVADQCTRLHASARVTNHNCFSTKAYEAYKKCGYDLVVTNPPYIRYQLNQKASKFVENWLEWKIILKQLTKYTQLTETLNNDEKNFIVDSIQSISGLSDYAVPCWLLSMMLVKRSGLMAIVLPTVWFSRDYSQIAKNVLNHLFEIEYVVNDQSASWFDGRAQVKTSIIIAKRKTKSNSNANHKIQYIDLISESIVQPHKKENYRLNLSEGSGYCAYVKRISQRDLILHPDKIWASDFSDILSIESCKTINSLGIKVSQGLRTGANSFFYLPQDFKVDAKSKKYILKAFQNQKDIRETYAAIDSTSNLLYIQDAVTPEDYQKLSHIICCTYSILPEQLSKYIIEKSHDRINGTPIPNLSTVRTNAKDIYSRSAQRFWYMLPKLTRRHTAPIFIPRVNSESPRARFNPNRLVIDANFLTIYPTQSCRFSNEIILAILNSTWCRLQCEAKGSVLGGGALKIDTPHISNIIIPNFDEKQLDELDYLGKDLISKNSDHESILRSIDTVFSFSLCSNDPFSLTKKLNQLLQYFLTIRKNETRRK